MRIAIIDNESEVQLESLTSDDKTEIASQCETLLQIIHKEWETEDRDEEAKIKFRNYYECPDCKFPWTDDGECITDDTCPACKRRNISPYTSDDLYRLHHCHVCNAQWEDNIMVKDCPNCGEKEIGSYLDVKDKQ